LLPDRWFSYILNDAGQTFEETLATIRAKPDFSSSEHQPRKSIPARIVTTVSTRTHARKTGRLDHFEEIEKRVNDIWSSFSASKQKQFQIVSLRRVADRHRRAYDNVGTLMAALAGISAVIAALAVQLLSPHHQGATFAGFVVALISFAIGGAASISGMFRADDFGLPAMPLPDPNEESISVLDGYLTSATDYFKIFKARRDRRLAIASLTLVTMLASLVLLAIGQTA
jgi:hypothetical protein